MFLFLIFESWSKCVFLYHKFSRKRKKRVQNFMRFRVRLILQFHNNNLYFKKILQNVKCLALQFKNHLI
jgi:hypothetical protein